MKYVAVFVAIAAVVVLQCESKTFKRCELVRELRSQGFPENKLRDWVCLVESESSGNSNKVSKENKNGSRDYGLFQINDKYWCSHTSTAGKDCNVTCAELITDDITKAAKCAKKVFKRHGFNAWYGWKNRCQGTLPDISSC
ncbi:lysozyme-like [Pararge aegeria]|uniref:Lysozyme n=2 Tax=Pararge aegeria TaxID=116150 RepID=A0A8S4R8Q0_9NEOP|nr:lysozyme-like [Pararge aegeria]CAH2232673.1 jg5298 [Pararge aegeria aegeria]